MYWWPSAGHVGYADRGGNLQGMLCLPHAASIRHGESHTL